MAVQSFFFDTPATEWQVQHNFNSHFVNIDVVVFYNSAWETILPTDIKSLNANTTLVTFTTPMTGLARVAY
jgi:hypothetical protein